MHIESLLLKYNVVRQDRCNGYAGVAILFIKTIKCEKLTLRGINEFMFRGIKLHEFKFSIFSIYRTNECTISCNSNVKFFSQMSTSFMICGDFNARHATFGSE